MEGYLEAGGVCQSLRQCGIKWWGTQQNPTPVSQSFRGWKLWGCRLLEPLASSVLSGSSLVWKNILGYISNNLNQLAKSTKFLLLCLALKFLQPWLNRQERVIKLNLWNKNRPFGTSHTHTAGVPKSLSVFHVSNRVVLPLHPHVSEQAFF